MTYIDSSVWERLQADLPKGDAITARPANPEVSQILLAGIDAEGNRHFLIPLSQEEKALNDSQSRGILVTSKDLRVKSHAQDQQPSRYMDIVCQDAAGHGAFDAIGREIAVSLAANTGSKTELVRSILSKWRRFWGRAPSIMLSREEITGLFAEVWFLHRWLLPYEDHITAVKRWRGPYGSRHDFEWQGKSVEVKGTTSTRGRIHWIHGLDQLSPPEGGKLLFFSLRLREEGGAANTLPALIASCRSALANNAEALTGFENSLALTGYSPLHDEEYEKLHLRVVDEVLFVVQDSFPKITVGTFQNGVPSGVESVNYEINLEGHDALIIAREPSKELLR